jgi:GMP synthase (glutamine-hydrolysing)
MKRFLLLQSRPEKLAADNEYEAFLKFTGLDPNQLVRIDISKHGIPEIQLTNYSALLLGGGPYNVSDNTEKKSSGQLKYERSLSKLIDQVVAEDFPFLAACGIGIIIQSQGGLVSRKYGEPVGRLSIALSDEGRKDKLLKGLLPNFEALGGHKEACEVLPESATLLAVSDRCPVQMLRIGRNLYATQFHSELDGPGLALRIQVYKNAGYFHPDEADNLIQSALASVVTEPVKILRNFVKMYSGS